MSERTEFPYWDSDVDIIGDDAGNLFIETSAGGVDPDTGWGCPEAKARADRVLASFSNGGSDGPASTTARSERKP